MFSSTLRKRPFWRHLAPILDSSSIASFQESPIASTDLIIPVRTDQTQNTARVLLLTVNDLASDEAERRLQELSDAVRSAHALDVVVLIHEQDPSSNFMHSIMQLQNLLLQHGSPAVLHIPSVEKVMEELEKFIKKLETPLQGALPQQHSTEQLMAHATTTAPSSFLKQRQAAILSHLFGSIRGLERGTRTTGGQQMIQDNLGAAVARDVIDFWEDEWIV